jgi:phosphoglycolate phosphatase
VFDKDGTLLDFERTWAPVHRACAAAVADKAAHRDALMRAAGHDPETDRFVPGSPIVAGTARDVAEAWLPLLGPAHGDLAALTALLDATFTAQAARCAVPVDGLSDTLRQLAEAGVVMGVATSDNTDSAEAGLSAMGVRAHFDFVCGYDAGHGHKPGPGMVLGFCAQVGLSPAVVAVVGDSLHDLHMARAAQAGLVVGVLTGPATHAELAPHADMVLGSIAELPQLLG